MLRRYFQITDRDGSENIQERVVTQVLELDNMLKDTTRLSFRYSARCRTNGVFLYQAGKTGYHNVKT